MTTGSRDDDFVPLVTTFMGRNGAYYARAFNRIAETRGLMMLFNGWAALLGPVWLGSRALWGAFWLAFIVELFAVVLAGVGLFGDLGSRSVERADCLAQQAAERMAAAELAITEGKSLGERMQRSAEAVAQASEKGSHHQTVGSNT